MLNQADADTLIAMPKQLLDQTPLPFPHPGEHRSWQAESLDKREKFLMDVNRGRLRLVKCSYQERYRAVEILVRVDVAGPPHRNPDGEVVPCPHIHLYREGFADKWAEPLPADCFTDPKDLVQTFREFLSYCNVQSVPDIQASLQ